MMTSFVPSWLMLNMVLFSIDNIVWLREEHLGRGERREGHAATWAGLVRVKKNDSTCGVENLRQARRSTVHTRNGRVETFDYRTTAVVALTPTFVCFTDNFIVAPQHRARSGVQHREPRGSKELCLGAFYVL